MDDFKGIVRLFFEAGVLKTMPRSGWFLAGIENPESVAAHSFRTALIGFFLAKTENADENRVVKMCLLHDLAEVRVGELNRVNARYIDSKRAEKTAFEDIFRNIQDKDALRLFDEFTLKMTKESIIARDADLLEVLIQAKEYADRGENERVANWIKNAGNALKTKSARKIAKMVKRSNSCDWWDGLKKLPKD